MVPLLLAPMIFLVAEARASCVAVDPEELLLDVSSCRVVYPEVEVALQRFVSLSSNPSDWEQLLVAYRGLLVEASHEGSEEESLFFFPEQPEQSCNALQRETLVHARVERACCDGDPNAPCLLGTSLRAASLPAPEPDPDAIPSYRRDGSRDQRYRVRADLNGDGNADLLLSHGLSLFGNSGGSFEVFLATTGGGFNAIGRIHLHPRLITIENAPAVTRIWTYGHGSSQSGTVGYFEIQDGRVSEYRGLQINPGDGGTSLGNALVDTVFSEAHRIRPERSEGVGESVRWVTAK